jgi:uncharacterized damage-inducible protein DinB
VKYFDGVRRRTVTAVDRVTPALVEWKPRPGEWTCAQIVRHLAGAERFFVTKVVEGRFTDDLDPGPAEPWQTTRVRLDADHRAQMARLATVPDGRLAEKVEDLDGRRLSAWRFLMAMVEHEVHHRSQLDSWLALAGTEPPQIYGYSMEEALAKAGARR